MKYLRISTLVIIAIGAMLALSGCLFKNGDLVLNETVCVNLEEFQTTGTFSSFVVCDQFKQALEKKLEQNGHGKKEVKSIHMVSATFKTITVQPHDWNVDAEIDIARQDIPDGAYEDGPAPLVVFEDQSLKALKGKPTDADLLTEGVELIDRALQTLLEDEDPRLILLIENESVTPTPSEADPMSFKLRVCVTFQMVVDLGKKNKP